MEAALFYPYFFVSYLTTSDICMTDKWWTENNLYVHTRGILEVLALNLPGDNEEDHETSQSGWTPLNTETFIVPTVRTNLELGCDAV
jgi:hypothetical protein